MGAAREKVRVAHCLQDLPLIDASFATGEISYSKVRAMTRVAIEGLLRRDGTLHSRGELGSDPTGSV
jgi:hypothetical protein